MSGTAIRDTWAIDIRDLTNSVWRSAGALIHSRHKHACGVLRVPSFGNGTTSVVIVAGGTDAQNSIITSVEMVTLVNVEELVQSGMVLVKSWDLGPTLPLPLSDAASTTTSDQKSMFVIGGATTVATERSQSVLKLSCSHGLDDDVSMLQCSWNAITDFELKTPSAKGLALTLPQFPIASSFDGVDCAEGNTSYRNTSTYLRMEIHDRHNIVQIIRVSCC